MSLYEFRKQISEALSLSAQDVARLIVRAPYAYKRYTIPKKGGGVRPIAQPAKETKIIQNILISDWFCRLPVHENAAAYKSGASIKANAERHKNNTFVAKFDFKNFFGSITYADLVNHLSYVFVNEVTKQSVLDMARVSCVRDRSSGDLILSIGAPSSPVLSNSIMYYFDLAVVEWCAERDVEYSRYADDLTFSAKDRGVLFSVKDFLLSTLEEIPYPKLSLNEEKTIYASKKNQRRVTGLIISNENKVSLGRDRKRLISAMVHKYSHQDLDEKAVTQLQGLLAFAHDIEPLFIAKLRGKYSSKVIMDLMQKRGKKIK